MNVENRAYGVLLVLPAWFLIVAATGTEEVDAIYKQIESATDISVVQLRMTELVAKNSQASAAAFSKELEHLASDEEVSLVPFLNMMFGFGNSSDIRKVLVPELERIMNTPIDQDERLYASAVLAKLGVMDRVQWLIDQHRKSKSDFSNVSYAITTFNLLCKTNQDDAVEYVVNEAIHSTDPTLKLGTESCLRDAGNPAALEIMRRWNSVESGAFDLSVAEHYLQAIVAFGDENDSKFVEWLSRHATEYFHPNDVAAQIDPLIAAANDRIRRKSGNSWMALLATAIVLFGIGGVGLARLIRRRST